MRIALITPYYLPSTRGNAVTVRRIEQQLRRLGCEVAVFPLLAATAASIAAGIRAFAPDIAHGFHAVHCRPVAELLAAEGRIPYIFTMTGTDIYRQTETIGDAAVTAVLDRAAALVFFAEEVRGFFHKTYSRLTVATAVIPQGVVVPERYSPEPPATDAFNFLLPAGVRAVKNLLYPLAPLAELQQRQPQTRLLLAGGVIEPEYADRLTAALAGRPFARWLGEVAVTEMGALYNAAHVVLNSSLAEGGMANTLLEGMAHGRALLAADIEGNRLLLHGGEHGFLYQDASDLLHKAETLLLDNGLRRRMGAAGRAYVSRFCSPVQEAERYLALYAACCR